MLPHSFLAAGRSVVDNSFQHAEIAEADRLPEHLLCREDGRDRASQRHPGDVQTDEAASLDAFADLNVDGAGTLDWEVERVMTETRKRWLLTGCGLVRREFRLYRRSSIWYKSYTNAFSLRSAQEPAIERKPATRHWI